MSEESKRIKVTDKRLFTPDGELREEYSHLGSAEAAADPPGSPGAGAPDPGLAAGPPPEALGETGEVPIPPPPQSGRPDAPADRPEILDLVAMLAQQAALYLGDLALPDGSTAEDPALARIYIDFLDVLKRKTAGNLTRAESSALEDLLAQLRLRYVEKSG